MLTKTSLSAIRALTFLGLNMQEQPWSPRAMAAQLGESPTYLAKVVRHLVRAGVLKAHRGVAGGVSLNRQPGQISLLMIVEACQGAILGDFCSDASDLTQTCAFHQAGAELHEALVTILARWTLADFLQRPNPAPELAGQVQCWLSPCPRLQSLVSPSEKPQQAASGGARSDPMDNGHLEARAAKPRPRQTEGSSQLTEKRP